jgi:hypothetical protein
MNRGLSVSTDAAPPPGGLAAPWPKYSLLTKEWAIQDGSKTNMNPRQSRSSGSFNARPKRWDSNGSRDRPRGFQNAQKSYERYMALAQAEILNGDIVAAENYYQHAEHYLRSMSPDAETA